MWNIEEGWGVIDSPSTPGGCWAHFSHVAMTGFRSLQPGQLVELEWEPAQQDGYAYRAVRVRPRGLKPLHTPGGITPADGTSAYRSILTITIDEDPPV